MNCNGKMSRLERRWLKRCGRPWQALLTFIAGVMVRSVIYDVERQHETIGAVMDHVFFVACVAGVVMFWPAVWIVADWKFPDGNEQDGEPAT